MCVCCIFLTVIECIKCWLCGKRNGTYMYGMHSIFEIHEGGKYSCETLYICTLTLNAYEYYDPTASLGSFIFYNLFKIRIKLYVDAVLK